MSPLAAFLGPLLREGRAALSGRPGPAAGDAEAVALLRGAFAAHRLDVAGPPVEFDADSALAAAALVYQACWFLVSRDEPEAELTRMLTLPGPPRTAAQHLSADLTL